MSGMTDQALDFAGISRGQALAEWRFWSDIGENAGNVGFCEDSVGTDPACDDENLQ